MDWTWDFLQANQVFFHSATLATYEELYGYLVALDLRTKRCWHFMGLLSIQPCWLSIHIAFVSICWLKHTGVTSWQQKHCVRSHSNTPILSRIRGLRTVCSSSCALQLPSQKKYLAVALCYYQWLSVLFTLNSVLSSFKEIQTRRRIEAAKPQRDKAGAGWEWWSVSCS